MIRFFRRIFLPILTLCFLSAVGASLAAVTAAQTAQQGQTLRVTTKELAPFVIKNPDGTFRGFSIDLWDEIARRLNLEYQWVDAQTVGNQLQSVQDGTADVAIAGISMTPQREQLVDFSHPIFRSGLQIMVQAGGDEPVLEQVILAYLPTMLRVIAIGGLIAFLMANIIWLVERRQHPEFQRGYLRGIWEGTWWFFGVVATGEYPDDQPTRGLRRAITIVWWLVGVLLVAHFTATMTTTLTVQQLGGQINGLSDLPGRRVATVKDTVAAEYLSARFIRFTGVEKIEDAYVLLEQDEVDAVVFDAPVLNYFVNTAGKGFARMVGPLFAEDYYGIALPRNSVLRKSINETLLQIREDGTYEALVAKWFNNPNQP